MPIAVTRILGALFRVGINMLTTWLVARGALSQGDAAAWGGETAMWLAEITVWVLTALATVAWSVYQKRLADRHIAKAINEGRPGDSVVAVKEAVKQNISVAEASATMQQTK